MLAGLPLACSSIFQSPYESRVGARIIVRVESGRLGLAASERSRDLPPEIITRSDVVTLRGCDGAMSEQVFELEGHDEFTDAGGVGGA